MDCIGSHEAPDVLWGAAEIGKAIGRAEKATFNLLEAGYLPARKIGGRWCASRQKLLEALIGDDGAGVGDDGAGKSAEICHRIERAFIEQRRRERQQRQI